MLKVWARTQLTRSWSGGEWANHKLCLKGQAESQTQSFRKIKSKWEEKPLHCQYPKRTKEKDVDQDKTHNWLSTPGLKSETQGLSLLPKISALRPTTIETRSWKMAPAQCAESVSNFRKQLTTLSADALNLPRGDSTLRTLHSENKFLEKNPFFTYFSKAVFV